MKTFLQATCLVLAGFLVGSIASARAVANEPGRDLGSISANIERMTMALKDIARNDRSNVCECRCK